MLIRNINHWLLRGSGGDTVTKHRFEYPAITFFTPQNGVSSVFPHQGTWRGFVYWDFRDKKENAYPGSFFLDSEDIKS